MIRIDLDSIDDCDISFTIGDSMALYYTEKLNQVFTKSDLLKQFELYDNNVNKILEHSEEKTAFIEAQLWNDKYLSNVWKEKK